MGNYFFNEQETRVIDQEREISNDTDINNHDRKTLLQQINFSYEPVFSDSELLKKLFFYYSNNKQEMKKHEFEIFLNDFKDVYSDIKIVEEKEEITFEDFSNFLKRIFSKV